MLRRGASLAASVLILALALHAPASAQTSGELDVALREVSFEDSGFTRIVVSVVGTAVGTSILGAQNFEVSEEGRPVSGLSVDRLFASKTTSVSVALAMDYSRSTAGEALAAAKEAAKLFVDGLPEQVRVALIAFGDGATIRVPFTTDRGPIRDAIDALQATGGATPLYDAVVLASTELARSTGTQPNIVLFSDGRDSGSTATLAQAVTAVSDANAPVTSVLLSGTSGPAADPMRRLAEAEKGGRFLPVADAGLLTEAFAQVAQSISSQYVLRYPATSTTPSDLDINVSATVGTATAGDAGVFLNNRPAIPTGPEPERPLVPAFGKSSGLFIGIAAAFAGLLLFLAMLFYRPAGKRAEQMLARGLRLYSKTKGKEKRKSDDGVLGGTAVGRRAVELAGKVPRSKRFEEKTQAQLDQAAWPLRSTEFIVIQLGGALVGALLGFGLFGRWWLGVVLGVFGAIAPNLALSYGVQKRTTEFLSQLPDTLQLLSGSLQAGYGFLQAVDTVAREAAPPTSTEFARVLSEARLGMPLEDALDAMAERVGGEDFKWVVLAINIQRQVGGNLAQLLSTVANTLREREQVRRQIKVLSAEGRLSAVILVALPFTIFGYISLVNPEYMGELTGATIGRVMIGVALVLIGLGIVWMRKIIRIDV